MMAAPLGALVFLAGAPAAGHAKGGIFGLHTVGPFHGSEVRAHDGERWFGVYQRDSASSSTDVAGTIEVTPRVDEVADGEGEKTGRQVGFRPGATTPSGTLIFLARGGGD